MGASRGFSRRIANFEASRMVNSPEIRPRPPEISWRILSARLPLVNDSLPVGDDGSAGAIDDVVDAAAALPGQADRDHVTHLDSGGSGGFDGVVGQNGRSIEHTINAKPPGFMSFDRVGHFVGGVAVNISMTPISLAWRIVWKFGLVKVNAATVAVPDGLILLAVFDEEAVARDFVAVDNQAGVVLV